VQSARKQADVVIVSLHWGIHWVPVMLADYQPMVAHAVIDAGADAIIGHHPHILKAVEVYQGKPIFYSLGNFAMDTNSGYRPTDQPWRQQLKVAYARYGSPGPYDYRKLTEANYSMIALLHVENGSVQRVAFRPVVMEERVPRILTASDPLGKEIAAYVEQITAEVGLEAGFRVDGDEVVIEPARSVAHG
jgi:poly-gamma-glutamate synthesis protein (capsule biosynthesis protein)